MNYIAIAQEFIDHSDPAPAPGEHIDREQLAEQLANTELHVTPEETEIIAETIERLVAGERYHELFDR